MESKGRSLAKTITWRITGITLTFFLLFISTGSILFSLEASLAINLTKSVAYYAHERIWNKIKWGRCIENTGIREQGKD